MAETLPELRALSRRGADAAMLACIRFICEAKDGRDPAGLLAATLKGAIAAYDGAELDAYLEGFCDTLQKFIEAQGLGKPTISETLR